MLSKFFAIFIILMLSLIPTYIAIGLLQWTDPVGFFQKLMFLCLMAPTLGKVQLDIFNAQLSTSGKDYR